MRTPPVTEVEILYDRESDSPLPRSAIDLTFTQSRRRGRFRRGEKQLPPLLGDGLDLEDPMVSSHVGVNSELGHDEKAAMDPSHILNGHDRLRYPKSATMSETNKAEANEKLKDDFFG
ncbi:Uncharacterized protein PECH_008980 [Penicillium ucsense]|uniref:Uncharacterized protein n=1 Tax=Penicillium ucsense TaxID=2839758 RepID=A0A8J8WAC8_9EURO|nr:Uncharacterized protein PECM_001438 [Penicillium ucsense]KAF7733765.1 Uncharacterized protein PECH_008980 [Penicillium ucsense]